MSDTIFTKIIEGSIPCYKVYENDFVLAFLDINPLAQGHTLLIPKEPAQTIDKLSDESAQELGRALPKVARAVMKATGVQQYNILQNNGPRAHQAVMHLHFHIIPKPSEGGGLGIEWPAQTLDVDSAQQLVCAMREELSKET